MPINVSPHASSATQRKYVSTILRLGIESASANLSVSMVYMPSGNTVLQ